MDYEIISNAIWPLWALALIAFGVYGYLQIKKINELEAELEEDE